MKQILTITRKELRGYFGSPMALIFIGTFLAVTLFSFFWINAFFGRDIADVRPLFRSMPILLIFLVAALTMRQWSEEQRSGTLEILLTLPVSTTQLVLGKFLAVLALVAIALALTIFLPITVSFLGNLDWGPVAGGYLAALLLAGAYTAMGLFVSSRTDNQIVALISTLLLGGVFYLVGASAFTGFFSNDVADILRALGSGSRFESIERGVVDIRDLLYYLSLTGIFLTFNVWSLKAKSWSQGERTRPQRYAVTLTSGLLIANLILVNVWTYPLRGLRLDMTQDHEYTLSPATRKLLSGLQEPLTIRGYFSEKTHPLLAPLVPQIVDMLDEYRVASGGKVHLEIVDPTKDPEKEAEANQVYGIRPTPFQVSGRYEASVINSYFDILILYGDQSKVLDFNDLIEVTPRHDGSPDVHLRNLEYDLTSAIKKTVYGFQNMDSILASLPEPVNLTVYITPNTLPDDLKDVPDTINKVLQDIAGSSNGKFTFTTVDPTSADSPIKPKELYDTYGIQPIPISLFSNQSYYLYMVLGSGQSAQVIYPSGDMSEASIKSALTSALKRLAPGFLQVVGLWTPPSTPTQNALGQMQQPFSTWKTIAKYLQQEYEVQQVDLSTGYVPPNVDVLVVVAPQNLGDKELYAIDQYLMRGGSVIVAAGNYAIMPDPYSGNIAALPVSGGVQPLLASYGITVTQAMVLDPQNEPFPIPVTRNVNGFQMQEITTVNYPFFVDVEPDGMAHGNPIVANIPAVTLNWVSPIQVDQQKNAAREVTVLLHSTDKSWLQSDANIQPDFDKYPDQGFGVQGTPQSYNLAVAVQGSFESYFKDRPSPFEADQQVQNDQNQNQPQAPQAVAGTIKSSPDTARLVVIGSGEFLDDMVFQLSSALSQDRYINSLKFMQNAVSWSVEDTDLLNIRARGTTSRLLKPMDESQQSFWEILNYVLALLSLIVLGFVWSYKQRNERPMQLEDPEKFK